MGNHMDAGSCVSTLEWKQFTIRAAGCTRCIHHLWSCMAMSAFASRLRQSVTQQLHKKKEKTSEPQWRPALGCVAVIHHCEQQHFPVQKAHGVTPLNYISSGMFWSVCWMRPWLLRSLPTDALDTSPACWIINLLPLCPHPILDKHPPTPRPPPTLRDESEGESIAFSRPKALLHLCWHTNADTYALE